MNRITNTLFLCLFIASACGPADLQEPIVSPESTNENEMAPVPTPQMPEPMHRCDPPTLPSEPPTMPEDNPPESEVLTVPVSIVLIQSENIAELNASFDDATLLARFEEINSIWSQANIAFEISNITRVQATDEARYLEAIQNPSARAAGVIKRATPSDALAPQTWNFILIEDLGQNPPGVYSCNDGVLISARYFGQRDRAVPANVWAHELGHSLGLPHLCGAGSNLMCADGMQPTALVQTQIERARLQAASGLPSACGE